MIATFGECVTRELDVEGGTNTYVQFDTRADSERPCPSVAFVVGEFLDGSGARVLVNGTYHGPQASTWADGTYTRGSEGGTFVMRD